MSDIKDFSGPKVDPIRFTIDGDVFECAGRAPMGALEDLLDIAKLSAEMGLTDLSALTPTTENLAFAEAALRKTVEFLDAVMLTESRERFAARMRDPDRPIGVDQINGVAEWLMEKYAGRPTGPPSPSSNGLGGTGASSTAGALPTMSIPEPSLSTGSST